MTHGTQNRFREANWLVLFCWLSSRHLVSFFSRTRYLNEQNVAESKPDHKTLGLWDRHVILRCPCCLYCLTVPMLARAWKQHSRTGGLDVEMREQIWHCCERLETGQIQKQRLGFENWFRRMIMLRTKIVKIHPLLLHCAARKSRKNWKVLVM